MKQVKVLKAHSYLGKQRKVGEIYPIRRADIRLLRALGRIEMAPTAIPVVQNPIPVIKADVEEAPTARYSWRTQIAEEATEVKRRPGRPRKAKDE